MTYLIINGNVDDNEEKEGNESMDDQIKIDAVDLDIVRVGSETGGDNLLIDRDALTAATAHMGDIIDDRADVCLKSPLNDFMFKKLRNVV